MNLEQAACEYFFLVSKLEYALKNSNFVKDDDGKAKPNWNEFKNTICSRITIPAHDENVQYLASHPPKKQTYSDGRLGVSNPQSISLSNVKGLIDACLTIRNNLFHGGKHNDDQVRNLKLLKAAEIILYAALDASPQKTREAFREAHL